MKDANNDNNCRDYYRKYYILHRTFLQYDAIRLTGPLGKKIQEAQRKTKVLYFDAPCWEGWGHKTPNSIKQKYGKNTKTKVINL